MYERDKQKNEMKKQVNKNVEQVVNGNVYGLDKEKLVENALLNLRKALDEPNLSSERILYCCRELEKLSPNDALAKFYSIVMMSAPQELEKYLLTLDVGSFRSDLEQMATTLIKSLQAEKLNAVSMFISKIKDVDSAVHERVATMFEQESLNIEDGLYDPTIPRDAFIAYRSTDMSKVVDLVGYLEREAGLRCFVSYRNLQHGIGARENYDRLLEQAMDHCTVLVFVSSVCSRREGDARQKELLYVENQDMDRCPRECQASGYASIPQKYKKPRVEYLIEPYTDKVTENFAKAFFDGYTQRESPKAVADAIIRIKDDIKRSRIANVSDAKGTVESNKDSNKRQEPVTNPRPEDGKVTSSSSTLPTNPPINESPKGADTPAGSFPSDAKAQYNLGNSYYYGIGVQQDYKQAVYWYRKAAEQGNTDAQKNLGYCYDQGNGVQQDYQQAVYWYRKAAEQGNTDAQNNLGCCYDQGNGVQQDYKQAVYWYRKAAEQGNAAAQNNLGNSYYYGNGVEQDYKQAVYWYRKAAEQENISAQFNLGNSYYYGNGVQQDYKRAVYWYRKAAEQGYAAAQNVLKRLGL